MTEFYEFTLPDGKNAKLTIQQARSFGCPKMNERCQEIIDFNRSKNKGAYKKDGFKPGWQENIREYCGSRGQYDRRLKELGLVEIGNEGRVVESTSKAFNPFEIEEFCKEVYDSLDSKSENLIEAFKKGIAQKDDTISIDI